MNVLFVNLKRRADSTSCGRERHGANYAQAVVAVPGPLNWRNASDAPRAAIHWLQAEASFINEGDGCAAASGFFLTRGQSHFRQRSTAAGSCSRATCRGFCGLKPSAWRIRDKCPAWYWTLNRFRITAAIREQVHRSVRYPAIVGPASTISINSSRCVSESLGWAGVWLGRQGLDTAGLPGRLPALDARTIDAKLLGHDVQRLPCLEILCSATTTSFQLRRTACWSHAYSYDASDTEGSFTGKDQ